MPLLFHVPESWPHSLRSILRQTGGAAETVFLYPNKLKQMTRIRIEVAVQYKRQVQSGK